MKIDIKIPRTSNLYSFVSNLSQWNELACIPKRKREWIQKTGKLNIKDRMLLKQFSQIMQAAEENIEPIFLFHKSEKIWLSVENKIGKNDCLQLRLIFKYFEKRFNIVWLEKIKKLQLIAKNIKRKELEINNSLNTVATLCGLSKKQVPAKMTLILVMSSDGRNDCQGWSYKQSVILECSGWSMKKIDELLYSILMHEYFHILLKRNTKLFTKFSRLINKNKKNINYSNFESWGAAIIFEEALVSSFVPEGYLAEENLGINARKIAEHAIKKNSDNLTKLRYYCALNLYELAGEYIKKRKSLDQEYFLSVISCVNNFLKN